MDTKTHMVELIARLKIRMDARRDTMVSFSKYGVQVEGWLKGELLSFLDTEKAEGKLLDFDREVTVQRRKIDIKLQFADSASAWVELKHWLIGQQKKAYWDVPYYFGDKTTNGIEPDVLKLKLTTTGDKYVLILATAGTTAEKWSEGVARFNKKFSSLCVSSLTDPRDYTAEYFLGLLAVE